jgi:hypothetical protein
MGAIGFVVRAPARSADEVVDEVHYFAGPLDVREMTDAGQDLQAASLPRVV